MCTCLYSLLFYVGSRDCGSPRLSRLVSMCHLASCHTTSYCTPSTLHILMKLQIKPLTILSFLI